MIVLVHEFDYAHGVSNVYGVDVEECPSRLRKLIGDTPEDTVMSVSYEDSISFGEDYSSDDFPSDGWLLKPPYTIEEVVTWNIY